ncbi:MAG: SUMF1/EgtB/PvdO family nonheme iron enzyme [Kiritimatiellae bacterium]|nr:SUMF1/EgtB/PvdO family nonheme iron enzyme [Kiritimatiellia bacterium]
MKAMKIGNRGIAVATALFHALVALAMPTEKELAEVRPLVNELMAPLVNEYKARKISGTEVGDKALELTESAESEAAVFVCMRGAVYYYSRDRAYDKAADAIEAIMEKFSDIPPEELLKITTSATRNASAKSAARLFAIHGATARKAANAKKLRTLRVQLKKTPADKDLIRRYAELTAADGDWGKALKVFVRLGGVVGKMAQDELDNSAGSSASLAAFWWNYKPIENTAAAAIRRHAAAHYQAALDASELSGLEITLAERRIAEAQPEGVASIRSASTSSKHRYEIVYFNGSWNEAKADAEKRGGHLATITSETEWMEVLEQCGPETRGTMMLGATDQGHEGEWRWVTGEKWEYAHWLNGQPDNCSNVEHYLVTHPENSRWNDVSEGHGNVHGYIIEYDTPFRSAAKTKEYARHKYIVVPGQFTWHEAKADAERRGGHLASVVCKEEWDEIKKQTMGLYMEVWLGATDEVKEGAWKWVTGETIDDFSLWQLGEPNNARGAEHYLRGFFGSWYDMPVSSGAIGYLLEYEPASVQRNVADFANGNPAWQTLTIDRHDAVRIDLGGGITMDFIKLDDFWIGRCEVTEAQYKRVMNDNPRARKQTGGGDCKRTTSSDCPVGNVNWLQSAAFCQMLNIRFKEHLPKGYYFSLPTAGQWKRATSGGGNSPECAWYDDNSGGIVHPVGTKKPNAFGICDLFGNVWEWMYGAGACARKPPRKGGGSNEGIMSAGYTMYTPNGRHYDQVGFRVAIVPLF